MREIKVPYEVNGKLHEGRVVYDEMIERPRPALYMQPNWYGVCEKNSSQAASIAGRDYVVLLADMFGAGHFEKQLAPSERLEQVKHLHTNLDFTLSCSNSAFDALMAEAVKLGCVDPAKPAVGVGFCAGAGVILDQMRNGLNLEACALFHSTLPNSAHPPAESKLRARCLILHGASDPVTSKADIDTLETELTAAGVDWQTVMFAKGLHSFTEPYCKPSPAERYDENSTLKSYTLMNDFFLNW
jgi:dienelactone hydrolase